MADRVLALSLVFDFCPKEIKSLNRELYNLSKRVRCDYLSNDFGRQTLNKIVYVKEILDADDRTVCELTSLVSLNLAGNNRVTDFGICNLSNLRILNLSNNKMITDNGLAFLDLEELDLSHNYTISSRGIRHMKLKRLNI